MRLIDADALYDFLTEQKEKETGAYSKGRNHGLDVARSALRNKEITPTIDAVPVVRCGECRKWDSDPDSYGRSDGPKGKCMKTFEVTSDDDFCSYGERKDGAE